LAAFLSWFGTEQEGIPTLCIYTCTIFAKVVPNYRYSHKLVQGPFGNHVQHCFLKNAGRIGSARLRGGSVVGSGSARSPGGLNGRPGSEGSLGGLRSASEGLVMSGVSPEDWSAKTAEKHMF
jgi:hypothetical protein